MPVGSPYQGDKTTHFDENPRDAQDSHITGGRNTMITTKKKSFKFVLQVVTSNGRKGWLCVKKAYRHRRRHLQR